MLDVHLWKLKNSDFKTFSSSIPTITFAPYAYVFAFFVSASYTSYMVQFKKKNYLDDLYTLSCLNLDFLSGGAAEENRESNEETISGLEETFSGLEETFSGFDEGSCPINQSINNIHGPISHCDFFQIFIIK